VFFGTSHLDQRYLGDDPTGSAAQSQTTPDTTGAVPPGTLIPAPIITPAVPTSFLTAHKPLLTVLAVAVVVYMALKSRSKK
jgi:hypothetical protein